MMTTKSTACTNASAKAAMATLALAVAAIAPAAHGQPAAVAAGQAAVAGASDQELMKQLANPVASLISLPFQLTYDRNIGPARDGERWTLNIQPVVPFRLNADWNVISRTILPVVGQNDIFPGAGSQSGVGDVVQSVFFSPVVPTNGWIWGVGPVLLLPTGSNRLLTADTWGAGPTAVALRQDGGLTYGALANHIWSIGGSGPGLSLTYLQPFVSYARPDLWSFGVNTETTYDWDRGQWSGPMNLIVSKLLTFGTQRVSVAAVAGNWIQSTDSSPHGWHFRVSATFLFPK